MVSRPTASPHLAGVGAHLQQGTLPALELVGLHVQGVGEVVVPEDLLQGVHHVLNCGLGLYQASHNGFGCGVQPDISRNADCSVAVLEGDVVEGAEVVVVFAVDRLVLVHHDAQYGVGADGAAVHLSLLGGGARVGNVDGRSYIVQQRLSGGKVERQLQPTEAQLFFPFFISVRKETNKVIKQI